VLVSDGATLRELARDAYAFDYRAATEVLGGEPWMSQERYDIVAKSDANWPRSQSLQLPALAQHLLRQLLKDRFKLVARIETKRRLVYRMTLARTVHTLGTNLKVAGSSRCRSVYASTTSAGAVEPGLTARTCRLLDGGNFVMAESITMADFAKFLATRMDVNATVLDETELVGKYDVLIKFRPSGLESTGKVEDRPLSIDALTEQLGLELKKAEGEVSVLVIDSAQRPSAN
jgi:uncharacterized protein (TIGR03435 family)